jgi:hypothetical protein
MSGFTAGIFSVAGMLVVAAIVTTLVKNYQGTEGLIQNTTAGFANDLLAAQGAVSQPLSYAQF